MGYGKVVEQFLILELYNELKLEFIAIKVILLLFKKILDVRFCLVHNRFVPIKIILAP
jgi:hypothetical protein